MIDLDTFRIWLSSLEGMTFERVTGIETALRNEGLLDIETELPEQISPADLDDRSSLTLREAIAFLFAVACARANSPTQAAALASQALAMPETARFKYSIQKSKADRGDPSRMRTDAQQCAWMSAAAMIAGYIHHPSRMKHRAACRARQRPTSLALMRQCGDHSHGYFSARAARTAGYAV